MARIEWLTHDDFAGRVGERFRVGPELELELLETVVSSEPGGRGPAGEERLQFSLLFGGPADPLLAQGTYPLDHASLGEVVLFLVPVARDGDGARYEAAFA